MTSLLEYSDRLPIVGLILVLAALWLASGWASVQRRLHKLMGLRGPQLRGRMGADLVLLCALALIGVALLGPRIGERQMTLSTAGADVVMLLDVSQSMDARDVPPSRLVRARSGTRELLRRLAQGDRVALVGFAGRGVAFTPLTPDRSALHQMLPSLDTRLIRPGGSDLGAGLAAALALFEEGSDRPRALVIFSDGEISQPILPTQVELLARAGVRVLAVAIGSEAGASVPDGGAPLRDAHDRVVTSRRSTSALEHLAAATDGALLMADRWGAVDTAALAAAVDRDISLESSIAPQGSIRRVIVPEARPFAALAFALLLLEALVAVGRRGHGAAGGATPRRWMPRALRAALPALLLCLVAAEAPTRPARHDPASTRSQLEHGFALARAGESARAAQAYSAAAVLSDDPALSALAHHNLGVLALQSDALERARDHFFEALVHAPNDHQMRFNAEWTLLALKARGREAPDGPPATEDTSPPSQRPEQPDADEPGPDMPSMGEAESSAGGMGAAASGLATPSRPLLDESERARWLERVVDDPGKAMRLTSQARNDTGSPPRRGGATW